MCFDRAEQEGAKMRLQYELFRAEAVRQCLQQVNDPQSAAVKVNSVIIVKKLSFSENEHSEGKLHDEEMLMKVRAARHENDSSARKTSWKSSLKQSVRILKNRKQKEIILPAVKNIRNGNYSDAVDLANKAVFSKNSKSTDVSRADVAMKKIFVDINSDSRVVKYKKTKLIKFSSAGVVETTKRLKKLAQIIKEQSDSVDVIK